MTERELLELAAKAAGYNVLPHLSASGEWVSGRSEMYLVSESGHPRRYWNPLTDDGDALRLAVKLELDMTRFDDHDIRVTGRSPVHGTPGKHFSMSQSINGCPYAATRLAIVRAAAEIGKVMQ